MSIKKNELIEFMSPIRYPEKVEFEAIRHMLIDKAAEYEIPLSVRLDEISYGTILNPSTMPCLVVYHPDHPTDYLGLCITRSLTGKYSTITVYSIGSSPQLYNENTSIFDGSGLTGALLGKVWGGERGKDITASSIGWSIGRSIGMAIRKGSIAMTSTPMALEQEKTWYSILNEIIEDIFS